MPESSDQLARLRQLEPSLRARIRGQDHVLSRVAEALVRGELGLSARGRPRASFLFVGPTGTGKTELALGFSEFLFGRGQLFRFDLSEYQNQSSVERLLGADRTDRGLLGRALAAQSRGTLLFDELEKAHPLVLDLFLQMLDPARITLATGESFSLEDHILVFTSNIGSAEAMRMERSSAVSIEAATLRRVEQFLRPELVARIDEKLVFARLSPATQREICVLMVEQEVARLRGLRHDISASPDVIEFLVREGYDPERGARPMRQAVARHLQDAVVRCLFSDGVCCGEVRVDPKHRSLAVISPMLKV